MIRFILRTLLTPNDEEKERLTTVLDEVRAHIVDAVEVAAEIVEAELGDEVGKLKQHVED